MKFLFCIYIDKLGELLYILTDIVSLGLRNIVSDFLVHSVAYSNFPLLPISSCFILSSIQKMFNYFSGFGTYYWDTIFFSCYKMC